MKIKCKYSDIVPLHKIIENPKNTNNHPDSQINLLAKIIDYQGIRHPIIISNLSGFIVAGHGRLMAAKKLGYENFPVDYQDFDNEAQEYAFLESDNHLAELAEHDKNKMFENIKEIENLDLEMIGIPDLVLPEMEQLEPGCDEDEVPEVKEKPITKKGDVWLLGNHRVMCGDSTMIDDVEKLKGNLADSFYCDPPYGIKYSGKGQPGDASGVTKTGQDFGMIKNDNDISVAQDAWCLAKGMSDNLFFWGANFYPSVLDNNCTWIVWNKKTIGENYSDCELAATTKKGRIKMFEHQWHGMIKASEQGKRRVHPTQKPVALAEWCFDEYKIGDIVCDLFLGSGSTLIACEKTNRKCYGMEIDEHYCDVIVNRWQKYTNKSAVLESNGKTYEELKNGQA